MARKRRRLTVEEEALLAAAEQWPGRPPLTLAFPIRLLEIGAKVWDTERDPVKILEAVLVGPAAVALASTTYHGWKGAARGTLTVIRPWLMKRRGRHREPWEAPLAEYEALRKAGKSAAVAALEVAKRHDEADAVEAVSADDGGWSAQRWIRKRLDRRRRARRRIAAK